MTKSKGGTTPDEGRVYYSDTVLRPGGRPAAGYRVGTPKTHLTLRLDPEIKDLVEQAAARSGLGVTQLVREWIVDRVRIELESGSLKPSTTDLAGESFLRKSLVQNFMRHAPSLINYVWDDVYREVRLDLELTTEGVLTQELGDSDSGVVWGSWRGGDDVMAHGKQTSAKAASAAGKVLANPKSTKAEKSAAASALAQKHGKGGKKT